MATVSIDVNAAVDTAAIAAAVEAALTIPTTAENAAAVAAAVPDDVAVQLACEAALVGPTGPLTKTAITHLGADAEVEVVPASVGYTIVVWGWVALGLSVVLPVEWRLSSGDAIEDPGNVDVTPLGYIGVAGVQAVPPGVRPLYAGEPSKALFSKKGSGIDIRGHVWWSTIPNP